MNKRAVRITCPTGVPEDGLVVEVDDRDALPGLTDLSYRLSAGQPAQLELRYEALWVQDVTGKAEVRVRIGREEFTPADVIALRDAVACAGSVTTPDDAPRAARAVEKIARLLSMEDVSHGT